MHVSPTLPHPPTSPTKMSCKYIHLAHFIEISESAYISLCSVPNAQSRRSGSSRSSRAGRVFSVRRTGTNRLPVYTSGHVRKGTSPFTSNTFHMALAAGTIYGSVRYMRSPRFRQRDYGKFVCSEKCVLHWDTDMYFNN